MVGYSSSMVVAIAPHGGSTLYFAIHFDHFESRQYQKLPDANIGQLYVAKHLKVIYNVTKANHRHRP